MEGKTTCVLLYVRPTHNRWADSRGMWRGGREGGESDFQLTSGIYLGVQKH